MTYYLIWKISDKLKLFDSWITTNANEGRCSFSDSCFCELLNNQDEALHDIWLEEVKKVDQ